MASGTIDIQTIYDDVEDLQARMTAAEAAIALLQNDITTLSGQITNQSNSAVALTQGQDLFTLPVGEYYSPSMTISESLVNKPYAKSSNVYVRVLEQNSGKRIIIFLYNTVDTSVNNKIWYAYERDAGFSSWFTGYLKPDDSGWKTLPLATGIEAYTSGTAPQYRKIGNVVYIRGVVKNVLSAGIIGTLPAGYRPTSMSYSFVQNTSTSSDGTANFSRCIVGTDGNIKIEAISPGAAFGASKWFPIACNFLVD